MRILLTNNSMGGRAGSELYVCDVAMRLHEMGHEPAAYSTARGEVAAMLQRAGIPVIDDLRDLPFTPDIIHGQHHLETMTALLALPGVPAVSYCHGAIPWEEAPLRFPRIHRYIAVDQACRERLRQEGGIADEKILLLPNFVDLRRFRPRAALPERPRRALIFSNYASESNYLQPVSEACARSGLTLDVRGQGVNQPCTEPESLLPDYDLVFAKGRAALEAMAVGCAVIVCDARGLGPMVTPEQFSHLRSWNFGFRTMLEKPVPEAIAAQIKRYSASAAAAVSQMVREQADMLPLIDRLVACYTAAIETQQRTPSDPAEELRAAADYLRWLSPVVKSAATPQVPWTNRPLMERLARFADKVGRGLRRL